MAGNKKRGGSKKSGFAVAVAAPANGALDELFVPKGDSAHAKAASNDSTQEEEEPVELTVNEKFAKTFLEQKRKEELSRLEKKRALYGDDDDDESDSESETEDEDGEQLTRALDADIRKTLKLIRKKDPAIYDTSIAFFKSDGGDDDGDDDSEDGDESGKKRSKKKERTSAPLYYKDLVRQQVIAGDIDSDDEQGDRSERVMTFGEEQAKLKQDFLSTLKKATSDDEEDDGNEDGDDDLDGGLFTIRKKTDDEKQIEDEEFASFTNKYGSKLKKNEIDPEAFLEHYLSSEGWKDKTDAIPHYDDIVNDDEDAEELEKAEEFEHSYNFRFEEEGSGTIQTYARRIEDSMRREDDSRKRARAERKERKALERLKKEEELRRLKNLKHAEIQSKLEKVAKLMGKDTPEAKLLASDLEGEFDPEEYDKRMQEVFDEEYYNEDDEDMEKPTWDEEEDKELFAGLPVDPEDEEELEEEELSNVIEADDEEDDEDAEEEQSDAEGEDEDAEKAKKMTKDELKRAKQKYLDELYSLDYEDLIGDLKCRFKYRQVKTNDFGLTVDEIMTADDKELKALVSLKRLAPYLDEEYQIDRKRVKQFKKSLEEAKRERMEKRKKKQDADEEAGENEEDGADAKQEPAGAADGAAKPVKKRKRAKKTKVVEEKEAQDASEKPQAEEEKVKATSDEKESDSKKKQRRSKKKSTDTNAFKATGLSSSRLESYKLTKPSKK